MCPVERIVSADGTEAQAHGEVGIGIEIARSIETADGRIQQTFAPIYLHRRFLHLHIQLESLRDQVDTQTDGRVVEQLIGRVALKEALQATRSSQLGMGIKRIDKSPVIASVLRGNGVVNFGQVGRIDLRAVFFQHGCKYFLIDIDIQILVCFHNLLQVGHYDVTFAFEVEVQDGESLLHQFRTVQKGFHKVRLCPVHLASVLIGKFQVGKQLQQVGTFIGRLLNPAAQFLLHGTLLLQYLQLADGTVHANAVFPVVGALVVFRSILDTDGIVAVHFALPDGLLYPPYVNLGLVGSLRHLLDAIRRQVALRTARIAQRHAEGAFAITVERNGCHV